MSSGDDYCGLCFNATKAPGFETCQECTEWLAYWTALTPTERASEDRAMADYASESSE